MNSIRRALIGMVALAVVSIGSVQPALAAQEPVGGGGFQFLSAGNITSIRHVGQDLVINQHTPAVIAGTFSGSLNFVETDVVHPDGSFLFFGVMTCQCTVDGRSGIVQIGVRGRSAVDGSTAGTFRVLDGTGGLSDLSGRGTLSQTPAQAATGAGSYVVTRLGSDD